MILVFVWRKHQLENLDTEKLVIQPKFIHGFFSLEKAFFIFLVFELQSCKKVFVKQLFYDDKMTSMKINAKKIANVAREEIYLN